MCEKKPLWSFAIRVEQQLRLDHESGIAQPGCDFSRFTTVDMDLHRMTAIALRLQPRLVADVKQELQRAAWTHHPAEVSKHRRHLVVGDVD